MCHVFHASWVFFLTFDIKARLGFMGRVWDQLISLRLDRATHGTTVCVLPSSTNSVGSLVCLSVLVLVSLCRLSRGLAVMPEYHSSVSGAAVAKAPGGVKVLRDDVLRNPAVS